MAVQCTMCNVQCTTHNTKCRMQGVSPQFPGAWGARRWTPCPYPPSRSQVPSDVIKRAHPAPALPRLTRYYHPEPEPKPPAAPAALCGTWHLALGTFYFWLLVLLAFGFWNFWAACRLCLCLCPCCMLLPTANGHCHCHCQWALYVVRGAALLATAATRLYDIYYSAHVAFESCISSLYLLDGAQTRARIYTYIRVAASQPSVSAASSSS
jgi:hypothetical protein